MKYRKYLFMFISLALSVLFLTTGCCSTKYSYYIYKKKGEEALLAKKYKKAQNYYSIIYTNESKKENVDREKTTWAFYRLGVIAEVSGDIKMAKGYYWGDAIDDGFYEDQPLTNWFAQAGWTQLDEYDSPRTLEEILEFEKTTPPEDEEMGTTDRKKEVILPKKSDKPKVNITNDSSGTLIKTFSRSKSLPPRGTPKPMKVYY